MLFGWQPRISETLLENRKRCLCTWLYSQFNEFVYLEIVFFWSSEMMLTLRLVMVQYYFFQLWMYTVCLLDCSRMKGSVPLSPLWYFSSYSVFSGPKSRSQIWAELNIKLPRVEWWTKKHWKCFVWSTVNSLTVLIDYWLLVYFDCNRQRWACCRHLHCITLLPRYLLNFVHDGRPTV